MGEIKIELLYSNMSNQNILILQDDLVVFIYLFLSNSNFSCNNSKLDLSINTPKQAFAKISEKVAKLLSIYGHIVVRT